MTTALHANDTAELDNLLSCLGLDDPTDVILPVEEEIIETNLEAAVLSAEAQDVVNAHYDEVSAESLLAEEKLIDPMADPTALLSDAPAEEAPVKESKAKTPKAPKGTKAPKVSVERKHYASTAERLTDKLGASLGDYTVLEMADALLEGAALEAKQLETIESFKTVGVKIQMRMGYLMEFAAGHSTELNYIAVTALKLLKSEGKLTTGEKGNLHLALAEKYSKASASSMGNNTLGAMRALKMIALGSKGEYIANPNSLYLLKLHSLLSM